MTTIITIMALLLTFQMIGTSQSLENSASFSHAANIFLANATLANATLANVTLANVTLANVNPANASISLLQLEGIWSFNLMGRGPVIAVLHQHGKMVTGSAKSEGTPPWNAVLQGSLSANLLELNMIYLGDNSLVTLQLEGNAQNEVIQGSYTRVDDQGNFEDGLITGNKISEDLSAYAPAKIPMLLGNPKYQDVHSLAGTVPESLGVGFVGDGTAGAGGMGLG